MRAICGIAFLGDSLLPISDHLHLISSNGYGSHIIRRRWTSTPGTPKKFEERFKFKGLDSVVTEANKAAVDIKNLVSKNDLKM